MSTVIHKSWSKQQTECFLQRLYLARNDSRQRNKYSTTAEIQYVWQRTGEPANISATQSSRAADFNESTNRSRLEQWHQCVIMLLLGMSIGVSWVHAIHLWDAGSLHYSAKQTNVAILTRKFIYQTHRLLFVLLKYLFIQSLTPNSLYMCSFHR